jgi:hypothetical protein
MLERVIGVLAMNRGTSKLYYVITTNEWTRLTKFFFFSRRSRALARFRASRFRRLASSASCWAA